MVSTMRTIAPFVSILALAAAPAYAENAGATAKVNKAFNVAALPANADSSSAAAKIHRVFDIVRGGDKIGTDTIDIERQNGTITVKLKTNVSVKVMFVEAYRYEHSCNEVWKNGQLVAFKSETNDNGTKHSVDVTAKPDKLSMEADGKHSELPKTAAPASLWSKDTIQKPEAFDPETGKRMSIKVTDLGEEPVTIHGVTHQAHHYRLSDTLEGDFTRDIWFDGDVPVRTKLIGSDNSVIVSDLR